jgi:hypothetical protein
VAGQKTGIKKILQNSNNWDEAVVYARSSFAPPIGTMKKIYAVILILAFAACYIPAVKMMLQADTTTCWVSIGDENQPEEKKDKTDKKEMKDMLGALSAIPQQATAKFSYTHSSHFLGDNPAADVLTPPPNQI